MTNIIGNITGVKFDKFNTYFGVRYYSRISICVNGSLDSTRYFDNIFSAYLYAKSMDNYGYNAVITINTCRPFIWGVDNADTFDYRAFDSVIKCIDYDIVDTLVSFVRDYINARVDCVYNTFGHNFAPNVSPCGTCDYRDDILDSMGYSRF